MIFSVTVLQRILLIQPSVYQLKASCFLTFVGTIIIFAVCVCKGINQQVKAARCTLLPAVYQVPTARQQYKNLQHVEHAFRDFNSDNIQIRPVYHLNEAQTRGHVLLSMFSYAIVK